MTAAGWSPQFTNEEALVSTSDGSLLGDLSPGHRQTVGLAVAGLGALGAAGAVAALAAGLVNRARRRAGKGGADRRS